MKFHDLAKSYAYERDFAFFVVNFGYSKQQYDALTETEKMFIHKAYENKEIHFFSFMRNAFLNALANSKRKRNKKFIDLFKKRQKRVDKEFNENATVAILRTEEKEGKSWVDKIYASLGRKRPLKKGE